MTEMYTPERLDTLPEQQLVAHQVLKRQQADAKRDLRTGYRSPTRAVLGFHKACARSLGFVDSDWVRYLFSLRGWWQLSAFISNPAQRKEMTDHPPEHPRHVREQHIDDHLLPAYRQAVRLLEDEANEHNVAAEDIDATDQRYLAMRPRLEQQYQGQRAVLKRALGIDSQGLHHEDPVTTMQAVVDWKEDVATYTSGHVDDDWLQLVTAKKGPWYPRLVQREPSARLLIKLARAVLPPMLDALREAAHRGSEEPQPEDTGPMEASQG